jgi:protoheme IX farnesyltransferase
VVELKSSQIRIGDYFSVMKPSIAMLNVFVGVAAILLAVGLNAPMVALLATAFAGFLSAGGAGALNCYIDRELDKRMTRTRKRPIPDGRVPAEQILALGLILSVGGIGLAAIYLNLLTAFFIGLGVFWYIFVYTLWLKPRTKWNIVIGGAAGCFSALAGWSAVTGTITIEGILVAALIFLWTPGHFWGLAIAKTQDYLNGDVPMLPAVDGIDRASFDTAISNILLFPFTLALFALTVNWSNLAVAIAVGVAVVLLNARFVLANVRLRREPGAMNAWKVFKLSAQYLFIILVLVVLGHVL